MIKQQKLEKIAYAVEKCRKCPLWKDPKAVPGEGNPEAEVMLVGEAPGYHESVQGKPFVGAAGKLLTQLLKFIDLERSEVFICNMLRHRPPGNRDPLPEEIKACEPFLDEQIKIIDPKIIVTLGRFSMAKFLPGEYISQIHGQKRNIDFGGRKYIVIPVYHPAAALRNAKIMEELKEDFQKISKLVVSQ
jgi:DNA polymerase